VKNLTFYVDGACKGNPGPMGIGIVALAEDVRKEFKHSLGHGTNQMAELQAVRRALMKVKDPANSAVTIYTDSQYAQGLLGQDWKAKANQELVWEIQRLIKTFGSFTIKKCSGHAGVKDNERADKLADIACYEEPELVLAVV